jgi:hypothetical protein
MKGSIEEASSVGSIKLLTYCSKPRVVDTKDKDETYPNVARPSIVEVKM